MVELLYRELGRQVGLLYRELGRQVGLLMTDPFGNYLFQKLVEMSTDEQRRSLVRPHGASDA